MNLSFSLDRSYLDEIVSTLSTLVYSFYHLLNNVQGFAPISRGYSAFVHFLVPRFLLLFQK